MITWGLVSRLIALLTALLVAPIAGGSGTPLSAAASAAPTAYTYDASAYVYDAPAQLSSPDIAATYVRGLPSRPEGASGEQSAFVSDHGVAANSGFTAPRVFTNRHAFLTNGKYSLDSPGMAPHITGATTTGKSQFLYRVNSDKAVLDAAAYADEAGLWVGNKAKVFVEDGPVGVIGRTGELTSWINVYRTRTGMVHGAPGSAP